MFWVVLPDPYCHAHSVRFCRVFSGCWVLGIGCIEYTYRIQIDSYERCSRAFHSVTPLKQCHVLRAYAHWLYQQRQPAPCRPVVSARRSKPPGSPWLLIPSCPAGATGPGLESRASIKHGPGMRMHMPRRGSGSPTICTAQLPTHTAITYSPRLRTSRRASPG